MIQRLAILSFFAAACGLLTTASTVAAQDGFVPIFDGKTLEGWDGAEGLWSVEDGAITGRTTADKPISSNTFLIWKGGEVGDFELRLKFRVVDGNSGIQFRSTDHGDHVVGGYQADIDATGRFMGILYEERGRGILANRGQKVLIKADGTKEDQGVTLENDAFAADLKAEDWNEYVIVAKGNHITQTINGHVTVDLTDEQSENAKSSGILAFQVHVGPPMVIQFKDVMLKKLD